mmetsp:Transcript_29437/g.65931  ORF Transcript_29437/g.65931 Transcript_29437/m.65931 type:complete len:555 (+) Transcript_29437:71-1735(+)
MTLTRVVWSAAALAGASSCHAFAGPPHLRPNLRAPVALAPQPTRLAPSGPKTRLAVLPGLAFPSALPAALKLKGGAGALAPLAGAGALLGTGMDRFFNEAFLGLIATVVLVRGVASVSKAAANKGGEPAEAEDAGALGLRWRFLAVFWLFRLSDWLQGPYFVEVYSSKVLGATGQGLGVDMIAKLFLTGFGTTALLGPMVGNWVDRYGRKKGSIAFAVFYALAALAVRSESLAVLFLGRVCGGIGTSLLFSAPEAWLVGEHGRKGFPGASLGKTFGLAYFGDSIAAMAAGQLAQASASRAGPAAPFTLSTVFLGLGAVLASTLWKENKREGSTTEAAGSDSGAKGASSGGAIGKAWQAMVADPRILMVGAIQSLFEGAMYIFVLQWPRALMSVAQDTGAAVPFGRAFSCFMAACMVGSSAFPWMADKKVAPEDSVSVMLSVAVAAMAASAALGHTGLGLVSAAFFAFEACVGFYFPSIGTLRSKYLPDEHRSIIMNLFGIPLNLLVVAVYLQIERLGTAGALACSTAALACSLVASLALGLTRRRDEAAQLAKA